MFKLLTKLSNEELRTWKLSIKINLLFIKQRFYSSSKAKIIINESGIENVFKSIYNAIIQNNQKSLVLLGYCIFWMIDSVTDHIISISKYNPLVGSSYIKLPKH